MRIFLFLSTHFHDSRFAISFISPQNIILTNCQALLQGKNILLKIFGASVLTFTAPKADSESTSWFCFYFSQKIGFDICKLSPISLEKYENHHQFVVCWISL